MQTQLRNLKHAYDAQCHIAEDQAARITARDVLLRDMLALLQTMRTPEYRAAVERMGERVEELYGN